MSKKSDYIFDTTAKAIRNDIWRGRVYDSLTRCCWKNGDAPTQRTVNDMMKRWERLAASIERDINWMQRHPTFSDGTQRDNKQLERNVEVARRLYLTIQHEQECLDADKAYWNGEITIDELHRICFGRR